MIAVVDNRDSFTFNLVHYLRELGAEVEVLRSDRARAADVLARAPAGVLLGPGPGVPERAGCCHELLAACADLPLLGVCLGHQALATALGGRLRRARELVHGKVRDVHHDGRGVFRGLPSPFGAARYHSLAVDGERLPRELLVSARAADGEIMGLRHRERPWEGVQFHPEALLSEHGHALLRNFVEAVLTGAGPRPGPSGATAPRRSALAPSARGRAGGGS